jgi:hypothetical protein
MEPSDFGWLAVILLALGTFFFFTVFSRRSRNVRQSTEAVDLRRSGDWVDRDSQGESSASYWPNS